MTVKNSFKNRSVLITGHTGFKGSWLAIWLHHLGAKVNGYSLPPPTIPNHFTTSGVRSLLASHYDGDVRDPIQLQAALEACRPAVIFHLAAQPVVRQSYVTPLETLEVNAMGVATLLDCVRKLGHHCAVVIVTSDKCYENHPSTEGHREDGRLGGHDPYSASKAAAELIAASYRQSFFPPDALEKHGVSVATVRAGNVIGGGDWAQDRIVPDIVRSLSNGQPIQVRNPGSIRPWQHVLEPLSGYLALASAMLSRPDPDWCSAWNFGPLAGGDASVRDLVETFCEAWGNGRWEDVSNSVQPFEEA
ncbi:MAG TPA: CDP-glucose 4,6-dehydratase, partial [Terriglobia bacterium]|nr:CDP-glucose 4,6-dehydratase [Terriglobia bacterium]